MLELLFESIIGIKLILFLIENMNIYLKIIFQPSKIKIKIIFFYYYKFLEKIF